MANAITIEGTAELDDFLKSHVAELDKTVVGSLSKGARVVNKSILAAMPSALQKFKPILTVKALNKAKFPAVLFGFFGRKLYYVNRRGTRWDAFFMVYWQNYGTLANRDGGHSFVKSRRSKTKNYRGGLLAKRFFESGVDSGYQTGLTTANDDLGKTLDAISNKYGFR